MVFPISFHLRTFKKICQGLNMPPLAWVTSYSFYMWNCLLWYQTRVHLGLYLQVSGISSSVRCLISPSAWEPSTGDAGLWSWDLLMHFATEPQPFPLVLGNFLHRKQKAGNSLNLFLHLSTQKKAGLGWTPTKVYLDGEDSMRIPNIIN